MLISILRNFRPSSGIYKIIDDIRISVVFYKGLVSKTTCIRGVLLYACSIFT